MSLLWLLLRFPSCAEGLHAEEDKDAAGNDHEEHGTRGHVELEFALGEFGDDAAERGNEAK